MTSFQRATVLVVAAFACGVRPAATAAQGVPPPATAPATDWGKTIAILPYTGFGPDTDRHCRAAFCIHPGGYFLTPADSVQVVRDSLRQQHAEEVDLVLFVGSDQQKTVRARILPLPPGLNERRVPARLLKVDGVSGLRAVPRMGTVRPAGATRPAGRAEVTLVGLSRGYVKDDGTYPAIVSGRMGLSEDWTLPAKDLGLTSYHAGPVLGGDGALVGYVGGRVEAKPGQPARMFVVRPDQFAVIAPEPLMAVEPPRVPGAGAAEVVADVCWLGDPTLKFDARLILTRTDGTRQVSAMTAMDDARFTARVARGAWGTSEIPYAVELLVDGHVVARAAGSLAAGGRATTSPSTAPAAPPPPPGVADDAPPRVTLRPFDKELVVVPLPGRAREWVVGGGGRYVCVFMANPNRVAVVDTSEAKITRLIDPEFAAVRMAAGVDKLVLASPDERLIGRWDLATGTREAVAPVPVDGTVRAMAMGNASRGPLLFAWSRPGLDRGRARCAFLDVQRLTLMDGLAVDWTGPDEANRVDLRAGAGAFFCAGSFCEHAPITIRVDGGSIDARRRPDVNYGWPILPLPDGVNVMLDDATAIDADLAGPNLPAREEAANPPGTILTAMPACQPNYVIKVRWREPVLDAWSIDQAVVAVAGHPRMCAALPPLPELTKVDADRFHRGRMEPYDRFIYVPAANLLVTVPPQDDRIVLRRFDAAAAMTAAGVDYLVVDTAPPRVARAGQAYDYRLRAKSKAGGLTYALESGPLGMTMGGDGHLSWVVPADSRGRAVRVSVAVHDAAGQVARQRYSVAIR